VSDGDHRAHDRDPDPAALDELRRAFGVDVDDLAADDAQETPATSRLGAVDPVGAGVPGVDESVIVTGRLDAVDPVVAPGAIDGTASGDGPVAGPPDDAGVAGPTEVVEPAEAPAILSADLPDVEQEPFDLVIVEQDAPVASGDDESSVPPESSPPAIIRIDDYAGASDPAADATPESLADRDEPTTAGSAPAPVDAAGGIISISDDEYPDAVYVEGSLEGGGGGTIVIIEDDDTGDALAPESERDLRRGIEPRLRERRMAVKRALGRRRLKRFVIVAVVVLVAVGALAVLGSPLFAVRADQVQVFNAVYTDPDRLQEVVDELVGTPVLRVDTSHLEEELEAIPWVDTAVVRTDFPHGATIEIREREAISTFQGPDGRFRVLDRHGRVLDVLDLYPYAYVLIGGPDAVDLDPGEFAPQGYAAASELAKNLTGSVRGHVTMINVDASGSRLTMDLDDGSQVFFGEARDLLAKLVRLEVVLAGGEEREPGLIDVSTADVTR